MGGVTLNGAIHHGFLSPLYYRLQVKQAKACDKVLCYISMTTHLLVDSNQKVPLTNKSFLTNVFKPQVVSSSHNRLISIAKYHK